MEPAGCSGSGVCAAVDVHYLSTGGARAAAALAADTAFAHVPAERTAVVPRVAPCRPGEFYLRELPPLRAVLAGLGGWACWWSTGTPIWTPMADPASVPMCTPSSASR